MKPTSWRLVSGVLGLAALSLATVSTRATSESDSMTFTRDVAPILNRNCVSCHRPGDIGPMSLLSYKEVRPWAKSIRRKVASHEMPPWGASPEFGTFSNDMSLEADEIATILAWVDQGAPEGDPNDQPALPSFPDDWVLGEPDYTIELDPVEVPAGGDDLFPEILVRLDLEEDRWLRAIEFLPGDRRVVHHILSIYARNPTGAVNDAGGIFAIWVAGSQPTVFPPGMGRLVAKDERIRINAHYHPTAEATTDRTRIGLHFGQGKLEKEVSTIYAVDTGFLIPPGDDDYRVEAFHLFDRDSRIVSFMPHMHVRGKSIRYQLVYPDGQRKTVLDVPRFDYNWQWIYYPTEPLRAPAESRLEVVARYDNSSNNPSNPDPGASIPYRGDTFMEMLVAFFEFVPEEGVHPQPLSTPEKLTRLLADHPEESSFRVDGLFPMGIFLPREGHGMAYLVVANAMFSITLRDIVWQGNQVAIHTSLPTQDAGGISALIQGKINSQGRFEGELHIGMEEAEKDPAKKVVRFRFVGERPISAGG